MLGRADLVAWRGLFAFATLDGLVLLEEDPQRSLGAFLGRGGKIDWVVGIDAVTTEGALIRLRQLAVNHTTAVTVRAYKSQPRESLFHPKLSIFEFASGDGAVLVGSSNLTVGGLSGNVELSGWIELDADGLSRWVHAHDEIANSQPHSAHVGDIDIEEVGRLRQQERQAMKAVTATVRIVEAGSEPSNGSERVLIRIVPRAGKRYEQVGIPAAVMSEFFRLAPGVDRSVRLQRVEPDGVVGNVEVRALVRSLTNRNSRIEIEGLREVAYPDDGRPLLIFVQVEDGFFRYCIRLPGDPGHAVLERFAESEPAQHSGTARDHRGSGRPPRPLARLPGMTRSRSGFGAQWVPPSTARCSDRGCGTARGGLGHRPAPRVRIASQAPPATRPVRIPRSTIGHRPPRTGRVRHKQQYPIRPKLFMRCRQFDVSY